MPNTPNLQQAGWTAENQLQIIAGPCAIEGEEIAMRVAEGVMATCAKLDLPVIFKGSYRKANRSRLDSFTGIGDEKALRILAKVGGNLWSADYHRYSCG